MNIYDFTVLNNKNEEVSLAKYEGKVLLVVNTATKCGLTPQYEGLEALYKEYNAKGFEILDFPCNQFREQAPEDNAGIDSFCKLTYGTTFPRFSKIEVNGENAAPVYAWLKEVAPEDINDEDSIAFENRLASKGITRETQSDILWNFGKFLIGKDGQIIGRYAPGVKPESLGAVIEKAL